MLARAYASAWLVAFGGVATPAAAQQPPIRADFAALLQRNELHVFNRTAVPLTDGTRTGVRVSAGPGEGPGYLPGVAFGNGIIEFDVRGQDLQGQSFVGVAFHGVDSVTYDAVYFRPFNFRATDPVRRAHGVQYISQPEQTWNRLRTEHPGKYEQAVEPVPDPNDWFHVRVVVDAPIVRVFVGDATAPTLVVTQLSNRKSGRVGIWVGNGSAGDFANLRIQPH
jgi:hypothetical protein